MCDVTNNNNLDISSMLNDAKIVITSNEIYIDNILEKYYSCEPYIPCGYKERSLVRIVCIKDDPTYSGCLLVTWAC